MVCNTDQPARPNVSEFSGQPPWVSAMGVVGGGEEEGAAAEVEVGEAPLDAAAASVVLVVVFFGFLDCLNISLNPGLHTCNRQDRQARRFTQSVRHAAPHARKHGNTETRACAHTNHIFFGADGCTFKRGVRCAYVVAAVCRRTLQGLAFLVGGVAADAASEEACRGTAACAA